MNKKFRFHLCLAGLLVFSMGACKVEIPEEVIPESEMENLSLRLPFGQVDGR